MLYTESLAIFSPKTPIAWRTLQTQPRRYFTCRAVWYKQQHQVKYWHCPVCGTRQLNLGWRRPVHLHLHNLWPASQPTNEPRTIVGLNQFTSHSPSTKKYWPSLNISTSSLLKFWLPQLGCSVHLPSREIRSKTWSTRSSKLPSVKESGLKLCSVMISSRSERRPVMTVSVTTSQQS